MLAIELSAQRVDISAIRPQPNGLWMEQIARSVGSEGDFPAGKKDLTHDRDPR
ncbi:MAG: hypothetical protein GF393_02830 [Armatimonadia bacterium]|nr:hypothetical protein [Armatimonadia bacterium]